MPIKCQTSNQMTTTKIFNIKKVNKLGIIKRLSKKRKFHKDSILKKIKSRFFKFFINNYMLKFCYILVDKDFNEKNGYCFNRNNIIFHNLHESFIKDVTVKRNFEWDFITKNVFELFHNYSNMDLNDVHLAYINNPKAFKEAIKKMDPLVESIIFEPFGAVFDKLLKIPDNYDSFLKQVLFDISKKVNDNFAREYYSKLFKEQVLNFVTHFNKY